jgi:magnesium transporter
MKFLPELHKRSQKAGQPPGTAIYTGEKKMAASRITVIIYDEHDFHETTDTKLEACLPIKKEKGITWINVEGLHDVEPINQLAKLYNLHPLTVEDILNNEQRAKVEEFADYVFITLKILQWQADQHIFTVEQISIVFGKDFVLSFQERDTKLFDPLKERLRGGLGQRFREHGSDYLAYRLVDTVVDQYFVVLEGMGEQIEHVEELIIAAPTQQNSRTLYHLKRQMLLLRKAVWPVREVVSHLLQADGNWFSAFTRVYLRDVYDHVAQAIDTVETFRDMLAGMLDIYLSSLSNRMNEVMKVLTIIATIFIPITFIASLYGMNFQYMPELRWRWGYPAVLTLMLIVVVAMLSYFRRKKWW